MTSFVSHHEHRAELAFADAPRRFYQHINSGSRFLSLSDMSIDEEMLPREKVRVSLRQSSSKRKRTNRQNKAGSQVPLSNGSRSAPYPRWRPIEDVFLHGIVLDTYARRHSLKPFNTDKGKSSNGETVVWSHVHKRYKVACQRFETLTGQYLGDRTVRAIQKRWKHGQHSERKDLAVDETGCFLNQLPTYKRYQREWDYKYNVDNLLTCSEKLFKDYYDTYCARLFEDLDFEQL